MSLSDCICCTTFFVFCVLVKRDLSSGTSTYTQDGLHINPACRVNTEYSADLCRHKTRRGQWGWCGSLQAVSGQVWGRSTPFTSLGTSRLHLGSSRSCCVWFPAVARTDNGFLFVSGQTTPNVTWQPDWRTWKAVTTQTCYQNPWGVKRQTWSSSHIQHRAGSAPIKIVGLFHQV